MAWEKRVNLFSMVDTSVESENEGFKEFSKKLEVLH